MNDEPLWGLAKILSNPDAMAHAKEHNGKAISHPCPFCDETIIFRIPYLPCFNNKWRLGFCSTTGRELHLSDDRQVYYCNMPCDPDCPASLVKEWPEKIKRNEYPA